MASFIVFVICSGAYPPTARLYEASMMTHMLLQLPLLSLAGWHLPLESTRIKPLLHRYDPYAVIAVIVLIGCSLFWMLPLNLDKVVSEPVFRALKLVTVPIGFGLSLRWIWLRAHPIVKIVVLLELWATMARLGWLYLESPEQLCSSYLIGEQRMVGTIILGIALCIGLYGLLTGIFGNFADQPNQHMADTAQNS